MNIRMGLIKKKPEWTDEAFQSYWKDTHGPLAARAPRLREYWQNAVTDRFQRGIDFARGPWDFDGFSQLSFDDAEQAGQAFRDGALAKELVADDNHFLGDVSIVTAERTVVVELPSPPDRAKLLKRISTLTRRPDLSEAEFRREWRVHADHVRRMPGIGGYRQNVVVERERIKGQRCDHATLPIDGIVELWFANAQTLEAAFASSQGQVTMAHAKTFLSEITAFLVTERRIV